MPGRPRSSCRATSNAEERFHICIGIPFANLAEGRTGVEVTWSQPGRNQAQGSTYSQQPDSRPVGLQYRNPPIRRGHIKVFVEIIDRTAIPYLILHENRGFGGSKGVRRYECHSTGPELRIYVRLVVVVEK